MSTALLTAKVSVAVPAALPPFGAPPGRAPGPTPDLGPRRGAPVLPPHGPVDHDQEHDQQRHHRGLWSRQSSFLLRVDPVPRNRSAPGRPSREKDIAHARDRPTSARTPRRAWTLIAGDVTDASAPDGD